jgi:transcription termination factor NusB
MEIPLSHKVVYEIEEAVSVSEVVESLLGTERLLKDVGPILEDCVPGLTVERIDVYITKIGRESPLREMFFAALFLTFQKDLEREVPNVVEKLFGIDVSDDYDTIVTVVFCLLAFYGLDFLYRQSRKLSERSRIQDQLEGLVKEVAEQTSTTEQHIRASLEKRYSKNRIRNLAKAALRFVDPSRRHADASIRIGARVIESEIIAEIPKDVEVLDLEEEELTEPYSGVEIELHAQDIDRQKQGWAGVVKEITPKRLRIHLYPTIKPEEI